MLSKLSQLDWMRKLILRSDPKTISTSVTAVINLKHQASKLKLGVWIRTRSK